MQQAAYGDRETGPFDRLLGAAIRRRRLAANLSLKDFARLCSISSPSLHNYETGQSRITVARLVQMAGLLDTTVDEIIREVEGAPYPGTPPSPALADHAALIAAYRRLPARLQKEILKTVTSLADPD